MTRQRSALGAMLLALACAALARALPASASNPHALDPSQIDPSRLALPTSALPPPLAICLSGTINGSGQISAGTATVQGSGGSGSIGCGLLASYRPSTSTAAGSIGIGSQTFAIAPGVPVAGLGTVTCGNHSAVSDNADADNVATPADGCAAQLRIIHQHSYADLGRITGYRQDFVWSLQGSIAGSEYLASVFPSPAAAKAAMDDATVSPALITLIGQPLPDPCRAGDSCLGFSGPVPGTTNKAVLAIFVRGPVLVETATQVDGNAFTALESALENALYSLLGAADGVAQAAMQPGSTPGGATDTPTATATTAAPTSTPIPTPQAAKPAVSFDTLTTLDAKGRPSRRFHRGDRLYTRETLTGMHIASTATLTLTQSYAYGDQSGHWVKGTHPVTQHVRIANGKHSHRVAYVIPSTVSNSVVRIRITVVVSLHGRKHSRSTTIQLTG